MPNSIQFVFNLFMPYIVFFNIQDCLWMLSGNPEPDTKRGQEPHFKLEETLARTSGDPSTHGWPDCNKTAVMSLLCVHQLFKLRICVQSCGFWRHTVLSTACNLFVFTVDYWYWSLCRHRSVLIWFPPDLLSSLYRKGSFLFFWPIGLEKEKHKRRPGTGTKSAPEACQTDSPSASTPIHTKHPDGAWKET